MNNESKMMNKDREDKEVVGEREEKKFEECCTNKEQPIEYNSR